MDINISEIIAGRRINYGLYARDLTEKGKAIKHNEGVIIPSASIIKILIMTAVMQKARDGELSLKTRVKIDNKDRVPYSIITVLDSENTYTLYDIVTLMIIQSDNTATNVLIDLLGMEYINRVAIEAGLRNTKLQRKMMDTEARKEGRENLTTAEDIGILLERIYKGEAVSSGYDAMMIDIMKEQLYKDILYLQIDDNVEAAHKTGQLDYIEHEAGIVYAKDKPYIFVMLTYDAESNNLAREVAGKTAKVVYDIFTKE